MTTKSILHDIEKRFEELREEILGSWEESRLREGLTAGLPRMPACDLTEDADAYTLTVELPGMEKSDVRLDIDDHGAHVKAEHKQETKEEKKGYLRQERSSRSFERYVTFPHQVAPDGARATFKNGVLDVHIPKVAADRKSSRPIDIS